MNNVALSVSRIDEEHRDVLFNIDLRQPVASLEDLSGEREGSELAIPWPGDFVAYYGGLNVFVEGMTLIVAKTMVPRPAILGALSAIRSRALKVATEIESAVPDAGEGRAGEDPLPREAHASVTHNIYGGSVAIGAGPAVVLSGPVGQLVVGDVSSVTLVEAIDRLTSEIDEADGSEAEKARVRRWLGEARAALSDTGSSVAAKLLAELVARGLHG
jgi:hypothetical protein